MMYAQGNDFVKDFAKRTRKNYEKAASGPYEITQLINSTVGLLIIPKEKQSDAISDTMLNNQLLQKMKSCVMVNTYPKSLTLCQICRHLRNAISHSRMEFDAGRPSSPSKPLAIQNIIFRDEHVENNIIVAEFEIKVSVDLLREFLFAFSDAVMNLP